jgi:hypothetical protein
MGKAAMYASVSVDGFSADGNDDPGPLFDWLTRDDVRASRPNRRSPG